jgi:hypothetical protein
VPAVPVRASFDRKLKALKPAPSGTRIDIWDAIVPGLGVRVTDGGTKTFVLLARYGSKHPTRRALGQYGAISLEAARVKARHWHELIYKGKDPAIEEERQRLAELRNVSPTRASSGWIASRNVSRSASEYCGLWSSVALPYICRTGLAVSYKSLISLARPTGIEPVFPP